MKNVTGSLQTKRGKYYAVLNLYDHTGKRKQKWVSTGYEIRGNKKAAKAFLDELDTTLIYHLKYSKIHQYIYLKTTQYLLNL